MKPIIAKAISKTREWVTGYPAVVSNEQVLFVEGTAVSIVQDTICYCINEVDMNGRELYVGDIVNDFSGGGLIENENFDGTQPVSIENPSWIRVGDDTRLGTIIMEDGTIRIETAELDYAYNLSNGAKLSDTDYVGKTFDEILKQQGI